MTAICNLGCYQLQGYSFSLATAVKLPFTFLRGINAG